MKHSVNGQIKKYIVQKEKCKIFKIVMFFFPDVACNACPWVLTSLDEMNVKFSCQSKVEIQHVLDQGIDASKIYFAGQTKVSI